MASIEYVVNATGNLAAFLEKAGLTVDKLDHQLEDLSKRIATPEVDLKDTKFTLGMVNAAKRLDKLSAMVADPKVEVDTEKAQVEILRINTMLDRLDAKHVTATVDVNTRGGVLSRLGSLFGGGGGSGAVKAGQGANAGGNAIGGALSSIPVTGQAIGIGAAALGADTLAPAAIPTALGAGFGGLGLVLTQAKGLQSVFADIVKTLKTAAAPMKGAFGDILQDFDKFVKSQGPALRDVFKASLPFLNVFVKALEQLGKTLLPVITTSLRQMTPYLPLISQGFVAVIQGLADMIQAIGPRGMQASAMLFVDLCRIMGVALTVLGKFLNGLAVTVQYTVHAIHQEWDDLRHLTNDAFVQIRHFIAASWDATWRDTVGRAQNGVAAVVASFRSFVRLIGAVMNSLRSAIVSAWNTIWANTVARVQAGINTVIGFFRALPGRVVNALTGLGHTLGSFAAAALNEMWNGFKRIGGSITSWFSNFGKSIISVVKKVLGVFSPSSVFFDIGVNLMKGLENGVKHGVGRAQAAAKAAAQSTAAAGRAGAGVQQWRGLVLQALRMEGLPAGLVADVLYQMQTESGGNPSAINLTDVNARNGDPSRGLMQVIGTTFAAYHWPGTSWDIFNPLANVAAALNYAAHNRGFGSGAGQIGSGHGYDSGGWLPVGASVAVNMTGQPELVVGPASMAQVVALLAQILRAVQVAPAATSAGTARALNSAARSAMGAR